MSEKILCVDDDASILQAYQRGLRKQFTIDVALGGEDALSKLQTQGPYAVVVSDMRMPGMDGVQLLGKVKQRSPDTVRIMLTGNTDLQTAIQAVNEGNIFRFLAKPCPPETLAKTLTAGIEQYRLITAEKELLEKTLRGSVKVLTDVLSLANPIAFGHASQARRLVRRICDELNVDEPWQLEVAAMLSQIGCVTVPPDTLEKAYRGRALKEDEIEMLAAHPSVGRDLVANIPRLREVARIIGYQDRRFDGSDGPSEGGSQKGFSPPPVSPQPSEKGSSRPPMGKDIPLGARILKIALDYQALERSGLTTIDATMKLRERPGWYDPDLLRVLEIVVGFEDAFEVREVMLKDLTAAMTLAEDVQAADGAIVVGKGQEVTESLRQRLKNFARHRRLHEPIRVLVRADSPSRAPARS